MQFRILVAVVVAVAGLNISASSAVAHTTIVAPAGSALPYQQWADEAKVPTPAEAIEIFEVPYDICGGGAAACAAEHRIWFDSRYFASEPTRPKFGHEMGHIFDEERSTAATRRQFRRLTGNRRPWDEADIAAPGEQFAEHYRRCALGRSARTASVCRLIRSM